MLEIEDHLAAFLDLAECRIPDVGCIDITALPGCRDFRWAQVQDLQLLRIDPLVREGGEQTVVGRRDEGHGHGLADEVEHGGDAGAVASHQRLGRANQADDIESLDRKLLACCGCERARSDISDVDRTGRNRRDDVRSAVELAPVDGRTDRLLVGAFGLRNLGWFNNRLETNDYITRRSRQGKREQRCPKDEVSFHGLATFREWSGALPEKD